MGSIATRGFASQKERKLTRKALRQDAAEKERAEQEACLNDLAVQLRIQLQEQVEAEALEKARNDFEQHERIGLLNHHKTQRNRQEDLDRKLAQEAAERKKKKTGNILRTDQLKLSGG